MKKNKDIVPVLNLAKKAGLYSDIHNRKGNEATLLRSVWLKTRKRAIETCFYFKRTQNSTAALPSKRKPVLQRQLWGEARPTWRGFGPLSPARSL